jgi:hypothetical protein
MKTDKQMTDAQVFKVEMTFWEKQKEKQKEKMINQSKKLDELVEKINLESTYQVVGRYRGQDIENEIINGYGLERLVLAPKDNLDKIFLTQFKYNNLFRQLPKNNGWVIFNPITNCTLTRGGETLE